MRIKLFHTICLTALSTAGLISCETKKTELAWVQDFSLIGSQSSPRGADLNGDGVLDVVMGAGKNEYQFSESGVMALDGRSGELIWRQSAGDQVFGSPTFYDVTGDGTPEVFIGGRSPHFKALDGKTGEVLWDYDHERYAEHPVLKHARFNFYNSVLVPDQNGDGLQDLLTVNGGNSKVKPYSTDNRFPGVLLILDGASGEVIAADTMPDGKESYMSPVAFTGRQDGEVTVVFGSGGETIGGNLYITPLSALRKSDISKATILASEEGHGFIAPPTIADVNGDDVLDIVAISHASTAFAFDGLSGNILWKRRIEGTESSNSLAPGFFTDDDVPDFFTFVSYGMWPENTGSVQVMINGKDGSVEYMTEMGCTGFSSAVVYDLNNDGIDEAIISINEFDCSTGFVNKKSSEILNRLIAVNFKTREIIPIDQLEGFKNIFSTPLIADMDGDGYLDIVHCQYFNPTSDLMVFLGMKIKRISTHIRARQQPAWGAYMGSSGDGIFRMD